MGLNGFKEVLVGQSICLKIWTFKVILATFSRRTGGRPKTVNSVYRNISAEGRRYFNYYYMVGCSDDSLQDWLRVILTPGRKP